MTRLRFAFLSALVAVAACGDTAKMGPPGGAHDGGVVVDGGVHCEGSCDRQSVVCNDQGNLTVTKPGTCVNGACVYSPTVTQCPYGCRSDPFPACKPRPCDATTCTVARPPTCSDGMTVRTFDDPGSCVANVCQRPSDPGKDTACAQACRDGQCQSLDVCPLGCSYGYHCDSGTCVTDTPPGPTPLVLDALDPPVPTVHVTGTITVNGGDPQCVPGQYRDGVGPAIQLTDKSTGHAVSVAGSCSFPSLFDVQLPLGTYEVRVFAGGASATLPADDRGHPQPGAYVIDPAFVVDGPKQGVVWDAKVVTVSGLLTINGATPLLAPTCSRSGWITFTNQDGALTLPVECSPAAFSTRLFPGSYQVRLSRNRDNFDSQSTIPPSDQNSGYIAASAFDASQSRSGITFDAQVTNLDATVTLNGGPVPIPANCNAAVGAVTIGLYDPVNRYSRQLPSGCTQPTQLALHDLFPGTYQVTAALGGGDKLVVLPSLTVPAAGPVTIDIPQVTVNVTITVNGGAWPASHGCGVVDLELHDTAVEPLATSGAVVTRGFWSPCTENGFTVQLTRGTYQVKLMSDDVIVDPAWTVTSATSAKTFDLQHATLDGAVTIDGGDPCALGPPTQVVLIDRATQTLKRTAAVSCGVPGHFSFDFWAGSYDVRFWSNGFGLNDPGGNRGLDSDDPQHGFLLPGISLAGGPMTLPTFDVTAPTIRGVVRYNGAELVPNCGVILGAHAARVHFVDHAQGYDRSALVECDTPSSFAQRIFPGTYEVSVMGYENEELSTGAHPLGSNLPEGSFLVMPSLRLP